MSKKFNLFQSKLTVTDNKVTISNAPIGDYAIDKHKLLLGTWNATNKSFDSSVLSPRKGNYRVTGTFVKSGVTKVLTCIQIKDSRIYLNSTDVAYGMDTSYLSLTITGGQDIDSTALYTVLLTYWTKQEE